MPKEKTLHDHEEEEPIWKDDDEPMELLHFTPLEQNLMNVRGYGAVRALRNYHKFSQPTIDAVVSDFEEWATHRATFLLPEAAPLLAGTRIIPSLV